MARRVFTFNIEADVALDVDQIWPDGDAPENPTVEDVAKVVAKCGGLRRVMRDWDLDDDLTLTIIDSDGKSTKEVRS